MPPIIVRPERDPAIVLRRGKGREGREGGKKKGEGEKDAESFLLFEGGRKKKEKREEGGKKGKKKKRRIDQLTSIFVTMA